MASLSNKSAEEIGELLDEYGIKHGPVVESTRRLYEKKLKEAMAKETKAKPSSDKTYYREEEEEVTYVYRTPTRNECSGDRGTYMRSRPDWTGREYGHETSYSDYTQSRSEYGGRDFAEQPAMYDTPSTYRNSSLHAAPVKSGQKAPGPAKSTRLVPLWLQFFFFLAVAVFLYFVFSNMETNKSIEGLD
ncbi:emerin (Emery-Dreifuss muscular dystrophy) isoform X2 [Kryptolebias marmoratus]|uniref:Si:ch211-150o23.2 n=1 Tax=Kryptolebias marmoratus TaxID=37003 RepID=A0A3Q3B0G9_KRYMA|nr:emerin (Emery-Dreifuss muscular dystrophy) isoform X2 [Kryptolebias marmoratus]